MSTIQRGGPGRPSGRPRAESPPARRPSRAAARRAAAAAGRPTSPAVAGRRRGRRRRPRRERLPDTRRSMTHKFDIQGHEGYLTVGFFDDGRPGELFITMAKEGSTVGGLMDVIGTLVSMGLQYGVPLDVFVNKFAHSRFEPSGFTKNPDIPIAKSITDYIFRWLGIQFVPGYREANTPRRDGGDARPTGRHPHARTGRPAVARSSRSTATARPPRPTWTMPRPCTIQHQHALPRRPSRRRWRRSKASRSSSPASRATPRPATTAAP